MPASSRFDPFEKQQKTSKWKQDVAGRDCLENPGKDHATCAFRAPDQVFTVPEDYHAEEKDIAYLDRFKAISRVVAAWANNDVVINRDGRVVIVWRFGLKAGVRADWHAFSLWHNESEKAFRAEDGAS